MTRFVILVIATATACWNTPATPIVRPEVPVGALQIRSQALGLHGTAALPDGGLVVVGTGTGGVAIGAATECASPDRKLFVTRVDAHGRVGWTRCLPSSTRLPAHVAASDHAIWVVRPVDPSAPDHSHGDLHDLVVLDRLALDGTPIDSRTIVVWHDQSGEPASERSNYLRANGLWLNAVAVSDDTLVLGGRSYSGTIVDGRWQIQARGDGTGFLVAFPASGPPRAVIAETSLDIADLDVRGRSYVATGRCWLFPGQPPGLVPCPGRTAAFVVDGELDAPRPAHVHVLDMEFQTLRTAIDAAGNVVVVAASLTPVTLDKRIVTSTCGSLFAVAASWRRDGTLRFARPLGDCLVRGPHARDEASSNHPTDVFDVAIVDGRALVAVKVYADPDRATAVHFDRASLSVPFAHASMVLELGATGGVTRHRKLRFIGKAATSEQRDASLARDAGVGPVSLAISGSRVWIVVEHGGSLDDGGHELLLPTSLSAEARSPCDSTDLLTTPTPPDADDEAPELVACRRAVVVDAAIEVLPW